MKFSIEPIVTERANNLSEKLKRYTFRVSTKANKHQIQMMVEDLYGVKVVAVNTMNYSGKNKSRYTKAGLIRGTENAYKKAIVTLAEGEKIDFYSNL